MRETLHGYNHLLRSTYVDISGLEKTYVKRQDSKRKTIRVPVNQRSKFVRRVFSRGEWYYNGRYYRGFSQQVGEEYRKDIRMDDVPTIEVDFKGLHPAIIAAMKGVNSVGDRYSLEEGLIPRLRLRPTKRCSEVAGTNCYQRKQQNPSISSTHRCLRHQVKT